ncbi:conserved hypothetical protein [Talaromyces stipitatus ATCC 10500]|uniref:NmrA-like domain-containing protein n=1 Tax=Talaromyces stipitatus (strain ATCC 10500 / CBS 375.48 / QM 6759 / NRRL 1006) TaxID=441959 RepID=B8LSZ0_TALSN|nr:uncharacterized protein TSTA_064530 [Talaromyces stipitatus ATCC 10500]EED22986.1 conserved hypothetical protein [Talaromyces stipitatus ATCC 10500]
MSAIKNVTLVGASGHLGTFVLEKLLASNKFNVQVIKRPDSRSTVTANVKAVEANFDDLESLTAALQGQDAVVSTISDKASMSQRLLIDAAIAAGVRRFLPSNFGSNMSNPNTRKLSVFKTKVLIEDYLIEKSKTTDLTYTFVYNGGFTDFAIQHKPTIFNGGDSHFSCTSLPTVGDAVVGVLTHPADTQNRAVYVSESMISQNQLFSLAKRISPNKPWAPVDADLDVVVTGALDRFAQGQHDMSTVIPILLKSIIDNEYGAKYVENDNELLGIKEKGDEYLVELLTPLLN